MVPVGYIHPADLAAEIERVKANFGPDVVHVKFTVGPDTGGDPAIYFRIVLTDAASRRENLAEVSQRIRTLVFDELHPQENWELYPYFSFRSKSEYTDLNDPAWA